MSTRVGSGLARNGDGRRDVQRARSGMRQPASKGGRVSSARSPKSGANRGLGWRSPHAIVGILCVFAIIVGWTARGEMDLSPTDGLGYGLGIAGLSMMTLLLGYSLRKRAGLLRNAGAMSTWFEIHLVLGLVGPTAILYHADFSLGSANATISLACVLAVSGSGIGGRFLYGRMHRGLAGTKRTVDGMRKRAHHELFPIEAILKNNADARILLAEFEFVAIKETRFPFRLLSVVWHRMRAWRTKRRVLRAIRKSGLPSREAAPVRRAVKENLSELCRAGELRLFERLFALWHAIHVPLTIILFASAAIHVVAVHLY
jgi:hypothetical protein